ncbi:MAG: hypothetical protein QXY47_05475 [Thermoplasmata archaeon]
MSDIKDAAVEAEKELSTPEGVEEETVTSSQEPTAETKGQIEENEGQANESQPKEESFSQSFDPNKLPEELKPIYKSMQADYTRKTQELARMRREYEQYRPIFQKLAENPELFNQVFGIQQTKQEEEIPDDPKEFARYLEERATQRAIEQMKRELIIENDIQQASSLDERLNDEAFAKMVFGLVAEDPEVKTGTKSFTQATREAIQRIDQYLENIKSQAKNEIMKKATEKSFVTNKRSTGTASSSQKISSIRDAAKAAEEELGF